MVEKTRHQRARVSTEIEHARAPQTSVPRLYLLRLEATFNHLAEEVHGGGATRVGHDSPRLSLAVTSILLLLLLVTSGFVAIHVDVAVDAAARIAVT